MEPQRRMHAAVGMSSGSTRRSAESGSPRSSLASAASTFLARPQRHLDVHRDAGRARRASRAGRPTRPRRGGRRSPATRSPPPGPRARSRGGRAAHQRARRLAGRPRPWAAAEPRSARGFGLVEPAAQPVHSRPARHRPRRCPALLLASAPPRRARCGGASAREAVPRDLERRRARAGDQQGVAVHLAGQGDPGLEGVGRGSRSSAAGELTAPRSGQHDRAAAARPGAPGRSRRRSASASLRAGAEELRERQHVGRGVLGSPAAIPRALAGLRRHLPAAATRGRLRRRAAGRRARPSRGRRLQNGRPMVTKQPTRASVGSAATMGSGLARGPFAASQVPARARRSARRPGCDWSEPGSE